MKALEVVYIYLYSFNKEAQTTACELPNIEAERNSN